MAEEQERYDLAKARVYDLRQAIEQLRGLAGGLRDAQRSRYEAELAAIDVCLDRLEGMLRFFLFP